MKSGHVRCAPKAEVISEHWRPYDGPFRVDGAVQEVIEVPKRSLEIILRIQRS
jgi:hypothetical protein